MAQTVPYSFPQDGEPGGAEYRTLFISGAQPRGFIIHYSFQVASEQLGQRERISE